MMLTASGFSNKTNNKYYVNKKSKTKKFDNIKHQRTNHVVRCEYSTDILDNLIKHYTVLDRFIVRHNDQDRFTDCSQASFKNMSSSSSLPSVKSFYAIPDEVGF